MKEGMHPGLYNRLPILAAMASSQAPKGPIVTAPLTSRYSSPSKAFGRVMAQALLTRQDRPQALAGRRQEFPRYRPLRSVADAQLSSLMHRSGLGRTYRRASVPSAGKGRRSSRGEVERYFQTGSSRGRSSRRDPSAFDNLIAKSAQRHQVPEELIKAVIKVESNFNPRATSPKGAMGLMQLMPGTARDLGVRQAYDPEQNIDGGTRYLKDLLDRYRGNVPMALAAYNWGPGNLEKGRSLPQETRNYLELVGRLYPVRQSRRPVIQKTAPEPAPRRPSGTGNSVYT
jgi:soluble lytic murein transglycosylase-like protein